MDLREARRLQTLREADRLSSEIAEWVADWKDADEDSQGYRGRYETQLNAIANEVTGATGKVRTIAADDAVAARPAGDVFADFNLHDQRLIWIRYAWSYFRDKLDQRLDKAVRPVLEAADEVSWSCFSIFFRQAGLAVPAAPIPYIEYDYVPSALRTGQGHVLNRRPGPDAGPLKTYFESLPVPLLRLPPATVTAPWALTLIAHEVGHLLQAYVEPGGGYPVTFANLVKDKVTGGGATEDDQKRWFVWGQEIFADLCMASAMGPWSIWALAPWVLTREAAMSQPQTNYPSPLVRLYLLDEFARKAGFAGGDAVFAALGLPLPNSVLAKTVAEIAGESIAINGKNQLPGVFLGSAPRELGPTGRVTRWSASLLAGSEILPENNKTSARDAAVAAARAHFLAVQQDRDLDALAAASTALIKACHDTGVRAGTQPAEPVKSLENALFELNDEDLLASGPLP